MSKLSAPFSLAPLALLAACAGPLVQRPDKAPQALPDGFAAYVLMGDGGAVARVVLDAPACPALVVDGASRPMALRAAPATLPLRANSAKEDAQPSAFPLRVCEAALPPGAATASVTSGGAPAPAYSVSLPLPRDQPRRIVVIGDTGCRLKKSGNEYQDCNDPQAYPFAAVAAAAAAWKPDLVVHVGDYHYRESPCPASQAGCAGSPHGYGWDTWREDFFRPGAALLAAAPWVVARGNHESCERAGQGWWRLLDPRPLQSGRDCVDPARDNAGDAPGNYSDPYAVPLGGGAQLLVADTAATTWKGLKPGDAGYEQYRATYRRLDALSRQAPWNLAVTHHPILGVGAELKPDGQLDWHLGDAGLQQSFGSLNPLLLPERVQVLLSGHVHLWQQLSFSSPHPSQFVAGFSGTAEDMAPLPARLPAGVSPAPGAVAEQFSSWIGGFGFMAMERGGPGEWTVTVHDRHGAIKNRCQISGKRSVCSVTQVQ
ncbi:metallophosphoesterase family protein [Pseudoduganella aquatica]|uniref:metallophosphoesterase family protein n=1 Tax=Pseudoduganella aquatica TaxID=2660641 RepID=UPI001E3ED76A|nr:metallophosphoesterase [Pseudoduganella aquatica]